jgi:hypothetical protein
MSGLGDLKTERDSGDEPDLGVDRLDAPVRQAVLDRGKDRGLVFDDPALQVDKGGDAAAAGPADPGL